MAPVDEHLPQGLDRGLRLFLGVLQVFRVLDRAYNLF